MLNNLQALIKWSTKYTMRCYVVPLGLKNDNTRPVAEATGYTTVSLQETVIRNLILVYNDEGVALGWYVTAFQA